MHEEIGDPLDLRDIIKREARRKGEGEGERGWRER